MKSLLQGKVKGLDIRHLNESADETESDKMRRFIQKIEESANRRIYTPNTCFHTLSILTTNLKTTKTIPLSLSFLTSEDTKIVKLFISRRSEREIASIN